MLDFVPLISLCEKALSRLSKLVNAYAKKKLSHEEIELLATASQRGEFLILETGQIPGSWVQAGTRHFMVQNDSTYAAKYLEAFRSLRARGYIIHSGGNLFMLTGFGLNKARKLAKVKYT